MEGHPIDKSRVFNPKTKKIILTWNVTFLQKSYGKYTKVEKPVLVITSCEGSDDEEELKLFPIVNNNNNNVKVVTDSNSEDNINNNNENVFDEDIDNEANMTLQTTINAKMVHAMKKLQALYDNSANKIINKAMQEKSAMENLNFLINLAMVTNNIKSTHEEPKTFNKA